MIKNTQIVLYLCEVWLVWNNKR